MTNNRMELTAVITKVYVPCDPIREMAHPILEHPSIG